LVWAYWLEIAWWLWIPEPVWWWQWPAELAWKLLWLRGLVES
jgi:hypothetical protein